MKESTLYTLDDFITDLELITSVDLDESDKVKKICRKMTLLLSSHDFLTEKEKETRNDTYARHLVHVDRKRRFIVVSIVWSPGQSTPIHDHGTWGVAGVVANELKVTNYDRIDDKQKRGYAEIRSSFNTIAKAGTVTYVIPPDEEIHKMENVSEKNSISLHVYGKELFQFNAYDLEKKTYTLQNVSFSNARGI